MRGHAIQPEARIRHALAPRPVCPASRCAEPLEDGASLVPRGTDPGLYKPPGSAAVSRAVPRGSRRCRDQRAALRSLSADPDLASLRGDFAHHVTEVYRVLVRHMDWHTGTSVPGRDNICRAVVRTCSGRPISLSTWKRCRRWLEEHGYLGTVSGGWTPMLGPGVLADPAEPNQAPVYVIAVPARAGVSRPRYPISERDDDCTGPLPSSRRDEGNPPHGRERQINPRIACAPRRPLSQTSSKHSWPLSSCPKNRTESRSAAAALQDRVRILMQLTPEHVRHLARVFFAADWLPSDVAHALNYLPGGRQHIHTREVAQPAAWARSRLALWLGPDGAPLPSASQQRAAYGAVRRSEATEQRRRTTARRDRAQDAAGAASDGAHLARELGLARDGDFARALRRRPAGRPAASVAERPPDGRSAASASVRAAPRRAGQPARAEPPRRVRVGEGGQFPAGAIYVGPPAPGLAGGPFAPLPAGSQEPSRYRGYLAAHPALAAAVHRDLAGRDLACRCPLDAACHADVLLTVAANGVVL